MIVFPNCKINLGLHILNKRDDWFHNIETVFYPLAFTDALEVIQNTQTDKTVEFTGTGLTVDGTTEDNLCIKAYYLLKKDFPDLPAINLHLHKAIPMGAGLGGGSADAAFMLKLLNDKFRLSLSAMQLAEYALQLGSDCPFFIMNKPCFATGRGEALKEVALDLSAFKIILVNPGIHINTGWAFSRVTPSAKRISIFETIQQPVETWKTGLSNDFEAPVFSSHPQIKEIKNTLYQQGALYASMTGSGSSVFGIFKEAIDPAPFEIKNYFTRIII